jgi:hypothetical protein
VAGQFDPPADPTDLGAATCSVAFEPCWSGAAEGSERAMPTTGPRMPSLARSLAAQAASRRPFPMSDDPNEHHQSATRILKRPAIAVRLCLFLPVVILPAYVPAAAPIQAKEPQLTFPPANNGSRWTRSGSRSHHKRAARLRGPTTRTTGLLPYLSRRLVA